MVESPPGKSAALAPELFRRFEERKRPHHIRADKIRRAKDRAVDVRFRREMDDGVDLVFAQQPIDQLSITNIALNKDVSLRVRQILQVFEGTSVRQQIEVDDFRLWFGFQQKSDEICPDKARAASDEDVLHLDYLRF